MTDLEIIGEVLGLDEVDCEIVRQLCDFVDHELNVERYGYPKDNVLPAPMSERLADPDYVERLQRAARDEEVSDAVREALQRMSIAP